MSCFFHCTFFLYAIWHLLIVFVFVVHTFISVLFLFVRVHSFIAAIALTFCINCMRYKRKRVCTSNTSFITTCECVCICIKWCVSSEAAGIYSIMYKMIFKFKPFAEYTENAFEKLCWLHWKDQILTFFHTLKWTQTFVTCCYSVHNKSSTMAFYNLQMDESFSTKHCSVLFLSFSPFSSICKAEPFCVYVFKMDGACTYFEFTWLGLLIFQWM